MPLTKRIQILTREEREFTIETDDPETAQAALDKQLGNITGLVAISDLTDWQHGVGSIWSVGVDEEGGAIMNLYLIYQTEKNQYDTYDSAVVSAESPEAARRIHPAEHRADWVPGSANESWDQWSWASNPDNVTVVLIGTAIKGTKHGVVLASFNG